MISTNEEASAAALSFESRERKRQTAYFNAEFPGKNGYKNMAFRLQPLDRRLNLAPTIRDGAVRYIKDNEIAWHTHSNHALSSHVCCMNFLMPLTEKPEMLSRLVGGALGIASPGMLKFESGPDGRPWFVGFEWN